MKRLTIGLVAAVALVIAGCDGGGLGSSWEWDLTTGEVFLIWAFLIGAMLLFFGLPTFVVILMTRRGNPPASSVVYVSDEAGNQHVARPAGFGLRFVAFAIDTTILLIAGIPLVLAPLLFPVLVIAYYSVGIGIWSTTIGKRVLRLYVLRTDGSKAGLGLALGRTIAYIFFWLSSFLSFGAPITVSSVMIAARTDHRGLHDLISGTVVVRRRPVSKPCDPYSPQRFSVDAS